MGMVIGQFSESFPPIMDGVGNVARNYAYWLNKKHGKSIIVTPQYPNYIDNEDFEVLRYSSIGVLTRPPYRTGVPQLDGRFMRKIRKVPFDVVHTHTPFSSGKVALDIARKRNIPIVASFHSKYYDDFLESFKIEGVARFGVSRIVDFYNSVDSVWTVNKSTAETLKEYGYKGNIEIIPNGTEYQPAENKGFEREKINSKLILGKNELVFIYVGQMVWQKNTKALLEALSIIKSNGIKFKMLMVGQGYALEDLKELSSSLNLSDVVMFQGAIHDRDYLRALYCRADLLLFPSLYDNASIVLREAASQGCPSLLIKGSNTAEGVIDNYNGFLADDGSDNIASRILSALKDTELMIKAGENAQKTIYTSWEVIVDDVYNRYNEIISAHRKINA